MIPSEFVDELEKVNKRLQKILKEKAKIENKIKRYEQNEYDKPQAKLFKGESWQNSQSSTTTSGRNSA